MSMKTPFQNVPIPQTGGIGARVMKASQQLMDSPWASVQDDLEALAIKKAVQEASASLSAAPSESLRPRANTKATAAGMKNWDLDDRELLAKTLMAEAGAESFDGILATGAVISNRARSGKFGGKSLRDVIMKPGQFSAWNGVTGYANGKGALDMANIRPTDQIYKAADMILSGNFQSPVGDATHYYNPDHADPDWGERAGGSWKRIGNHIFGYGN